MTTKTEIIKIRLADLYGRCSTPFDSEVKHEQFSSELV